MYLAYTCFAVRMLRGGDIFKTTAAGLDVDTFRTLCARFGASGAQLDLTQLPVDDVRALAGIRQAFDRAHLGIELSIPSRYFETPEAYGRAAAAAETLGATRARVGLLYGRRYESFDSRAAWEAFAARWRETLVRLGPELDGHRLRVGIENHKDWFAGELVDLLHAVDSPQLGVCVDFGNSLSMLEDPDETIDVLAPFAVTTHLKDMAVAITGDGFELAEVPLGEGMLPLAQYVGAIRRAAPSPTFALEMITRDPLPVPYRTERYWTAFEAGARRPERVEAFERRVLARARAAPLARLSILPLGQQIDAEDRHVRECVEYAARVLHLGAGQP